LSTRATARDREQCRRARLEGRGHDDRRGVRTGDDDIGHAGDACRHDRHEERRRKRIPPTGHVTAHPRERLHALLDPQPWCDDDGERPRHLTRRDTLEVSNGLAERATDVAWRLLPAAPNGGGAERSNRRRTPVQLSRPRPQRGITSVADVANDPRSLPLDIRPPRFVAGSQRLDGRTIGR
jgi:hypothetical protein